MIDEVLKEKPIKKPRKFIFHASWARGGDIAYSAIDKLNYEDKEFHAFDYLITIPSNDTKFFHKHDGVDKKTLFKHLAESEYFIYPLYTPYQDVHKDTFSCVVAEAIALGVTVITYPLGALHDNYKEYCQWLHLPVGFDLDIVQNEPLTKDLDGKFKIDDNIKKTKFYAVPPTLIAKDHANLLKTLTQLDEAIKKYQDLTQMIEQQLLKEKNPMIINKIEADTKRKQSQ